MDKIGASVTSYLDFDVDLGNREQDAYPTRVRSPGGEPNASFSLPFTEQELAVLNDDLAARRAWGGSGSDDKARRFGQALFSALLGGELETSYRISRDRARREGRGLRIRLSMRAAELAALPWELMFDDSEGDFVALSPHTPLIRYFELDRPSAPIPATIPLRVLGMIALPRDLASLDAARERRRIEDELAELVSRRRVELKWVEGETWRDLQRTVRDEAWNIFHFVGHGRAGPDGGSIILADKGSKSAPLDAEELGRLLAVQPCLALVLLNSCEGARVKSSEDLTSTAAALIRRGLPAVIAMQHEVSDSGAITIARDFYAGLADGLPVEAALAEARTASSIEGRGTYEWATPVLHMRATDGRLFDLRAERETRDVAPGGPKSTIHVEEDFPEIPGTSAKAWLMTIGAIGLALVVYVVFLVVTSR